MYLIVLLLSNNHFFVALNSVKMRKKIFLFFIIIITTCLVSVIGYFSYYYFKFPSVSAAPNIEFEHTPELVKRGEYLSNHIYVCFECHTPRNHELFGSPLIEDQQGAGGEQMSPKHHPGTFYTSNLTPTNLGNWTDGEIIRAINTGVDKDNNPIYWGMPSYKYSELPMEDLKAIVAYLRTLKPIENNVPESDPDWSIWKNNRTWQEDVTPPPAKVFSDSIEYGHFLAETAACIGCHTGFDKQFGNFNPELSLSGGYEFILRERIDTVRSSNITPDSTTGIGRWSKHDFIQRFKYFATEEGKTIPAPEGQFQSPMHWTMYAGMNEQDLGAIYDYLRTIEPVKNKVRVFSKGK